MTLKLRILKSLTGLFIILVSLTRSLLGMYQVSQNILAIKEKSFYASYMYLLPSLSLPKMLLYCNYRKPRNARRTEAQWQKSAESAAEKYSKYSKFQLRLDLLCWPRSAPQISNLYKDRGTVTKACWESAVKKYSKFQLRLELLCRATFCPKKFKFVRFKPSLGVIQEV